MKLVLSNNKSKPCSVQQGKSQPCKNIFTNLIIPDKSKNTLHKNRSSHRRCSVRKMFLEMSQNSQENTCARVSFLIKACNFIKKEALAQVFSCKFCEILKNTFLYRTPLVAAS